MIDHERFKWLLRHLGNIYLSSIHLSAQYIPVVIIGDIREDCCSIQVVDQHLLWGSDVALVELLCWAFAYQHIYEHYHPPTDETHGGAPSTFSMMFSLLIVRAPLPLAYRGDMICDMLLELPE